MVGRSAAEVYSEDTRAAQSYVAVSEKSQICTEKKMAVSRSFRGPYVTLPSGQYSSTNILRHRLRRLFEYTPQDQTQAFGGSCGIPSSCGGEAGGACRMRVRLVLQRVAGSRI